MAVAVLIASCIGGSQQPHSKPLNNSAKLLLVAVGRVKLYLLASFTIQLHSLVAFAMPRPYAVVNALLPTPAERILTAWIRQYPGALGVRRLTPITQEYLLEVLRHILSHTDELNLDREDVWELLTGADTLQFGTATASGTNRRKIVTRSMWNATVLLGSAEAPVKRVLLAVHGGLATALRVGELAQLIEIATKIAGGQAEVIFGHGCDARLGESIRVIFLASR